MSTRHLPHAACFLAIDQGGHGSRALVFDHHGVMLAQAHRPVNVAQPREGWVEQDPEELLESIRMAAAEALAGLSDSGKKVVAAGLATQRSSLVCWDRQTGKALSPVISWQDRRAHHWLKQLQPDEVTIHRATGLNVSAHYGASKFRWCLDHLPAVAAACEQGRLAMGPMASFLIFRLLEERPLLADPANASRTLLWNLKTQDWDPELMALFGLPIDVFPRCVPTRHAFGHLPIDNKHIPLVILTGDQSAAMYAFGRVQPDTAYVNVGTGAFLSRPSGHNPAYRRRLLTSIIHQEDTEATYVLEGTVNGAASALKWVEEELGLDRVYKRLPDWLARATKPPLFLNGVSGLGAPYWISDFASRFVGQGEPWEKVVAVVESIAFLLQTNLEEMGKLASPPQQIQISGGLAGLDGLCQRLADLSRLPVYRPKEREATARGTAYLLADCPSAWPETELGKWFKPSENQSLQDRYHEWHQEMVRAMRVTPLTEAEKA